MDAKGENAVPDERECLCLLREYGTPERVIAHCRGVERVARRMCEALKEKGYPLDLSLVKAGALLHDIARTEKHHDRVGAEYLKSIGLDRVGRLVAVHMSLPERDRTRISEKMLVYLADKLVSEDTEVTLAERFARSLEKAGPQMRPFIESRYEDAKKILALVQTALAFPDV
ncbi:MAG: HD domain-containing protein [Oscillospiraceae bacterium]|nr:HD domain-containing protein [Oscillospiraceae bacterium]